MSRLVRRSVHLVISECDLISELEIFLAKEQKNVLIVDAHYFDDLRINSPNPNKVTQSMVTVYLAGAFSSKSCEVKILNKHYGGLAEDRTLPGWPGIFVL